MKKILSVMLIFTLSLMVAGITQEVNADVADGTVYFHIHQFDGDYTGTGIGIWDGRDTVGWNAWADVVTVEDDFGGVVVKTYTAAELADPKLMSEIQLEITRSATASDDAGKQAGYLAGGNGKVFADISSLIDGSETEVHVYFVEGAKDVYLVEGPLVGGLFFNVYANPKVAADAMIYEDWGMHTWNNGGVSVTWDAPILYEIEMELTSGDFTIPMMLGVLDIGDGNTGDAGFIAHKGDTKSCGGDMSYDTDEILALDGSAFVALYEHGNCEFTADYDTFIASVAEMFEYFSGNAILASSVISTPTTIDVDFSMFKNPAQLDLSRFKLTDSEGNMIPLIGIDYTSLDTIGTFTSTETCAAGEYKLVVFASTALDHTKLGLVGGFNGWDIGNVATPIGDDTMGNAVFEICTTTATSEFKLLYDVDGTFEWALPTVELTKSNQAYDVDNDAMSGLFYVHADAIAAEVITPTVNLDDEIEKYVKVFVDTTLTNADLYAVGSFNGWDVENPNTYTEDSSLGYGVIEFVTGDTSVSFKVLHDGEADASYSWGDTQVTPNNVDIDLSGANEFTVFIDASGNAMVLPNVGASLPVDASDYTYTSTTTCSAGESLLTMFVASDQDHAKLGLVGDLNGWNINGTLSSVGDTANGLAVFEVCLAEGATGGYKVLFDEDGTFEWSSPTVQVTPSDQHYDLTSGDMAYYVQGVDTVGTFTPAITPTVTIKRLVRIYVDTDLDHTKLAVTGTFNNWGFGENVVMGVDEANGLAYFEVVNTSALLQFKVLYSEAGTFLDEGGDTVSVTPENQEFEIGGSNEIAVAVRSDVAELINLDLQFYDGSSMDLSVNHFVLSVDAANELQVGNEFFLSYVEEMVALPNELFISEYYEGSTGNNKAVEIYNPTGATIDLTDYALYGIGGSAGAQTNPLTGTLAAGEVLVVCADGVDNAVLVAECDVLLPYPSSVHFNGNDVVALMKNDVIIDIIGVVVDAGGADFAKDVVLVRNADVSMPNAVYTVAEWTSYPSETTEYLGAHTVDAMMNEVIMIENALSFANTNDFVEGNPVLNEGTFAVDTMSIMVGLVNTEAPITSMVLKDSEGTVIPFDTYTNAFMAGTYRVKKTCGTDQDMIFIHIKLTDTTVEKFGQLGAVGTINGWDVANSIPASGVDSNGNYVFEICIPDTDTEGQFKIKYDPDMDGFTWNSSDDPELTPAPNNVVFTVADGPHFYIEEGEIALDMSNQHMITLLEENALDKTEEYTLEFTDENGFVMSIPVLMDTEAPVIDFTVIPDVAFTYDTKDTFDLMNYYTKLQFIDNRDGEMAYEVLTPLNPATLGAQTIVLGATDSWGNAATFNINITVVDTTPPTITGDLTATFTAGDTEPDWTSYVTVTGGTLTVNDSQVDMTAAGDFFVIFTAEDTSGNKVTHTLAVTVEAAPEVPDTGCFSGFNGISALFITVSILLGASVLFYVRKP